jgi:hypothetical protein
LSRSCKLILWIISLLTQSAIKSFPRRQSEIKSFPRWLSQRWNRFRIDSDSDEIYSALADPFVRCPWKNYKNFLQLEQWASAKICFYIDSTSTCKNLYITRKHPNLNLTFDYKESKFKKKLTRNRSNSTKINTGSSHAQSTQKNRNTGKKL